jgi:hypothetical protein
LKDAGLRSARNAALGFGLAFLVFSFASSPYHAALTRISGWVLSVSGHEVTMWTERWRVQVSDPRGRRSEVRPAHITFNFLLLVALFSAHPRPWGQRNVRRFGIALLALVVIHMAAFYVTVRSNLARSDPDAGVMATNFWFLLAQGYAVVGAYALVFALWWLLRSDSPVPTKVV